MKTPSLSRRSLGRSVTLVPRVVCVTSSRKTLSPGTTPDSCHFSESLCEWPWLCHLSSPQVAPARRPSRRLPLPSAVRHRHYLPRPSRRLFPSGLAPFRGPPPLQPPLALRPGPPWKSPAGAVEVAAAAPSTRCRHRRCLRRRPSAAPS